MREGVEVFLAYLSVMLVAFLGFLGMQVWRSTVAYIDLEKFCVSDFTECFGYSPKDN